MREVKHIAYAIVGVSFFEIKKKYSFVLELHRFARNANNEMRNKAFGTI